MRAPCSSLCLILIACGGGGSGATPDARDRVVDGGLSDGAGVGAEPLRVLQAFVLNSSGDVWLTHGSHPAFSGQGCWDDLVELSAKITDTYGGGDERGRTIKFTTACE